jgi:hypothetical protein
MVISILEKAFGGMGKEERRNESRDFNTWSAYSFHFSLFLNTLFYFFIFFCMLVFLDPILEEKQSDGERGEEAIHYIMRA